MKIPFYTIYLSHSAYKLICFAREGFNRADVVFFFFFNLFHSAFSIEIDDFLEPLLQKLNYLDFVCCIAVFNLFKRICHNRNENVEQHQDHNDIVNHEQERPKGRIRVD